MPKVMPKSKPPLTMPVSFYCPTPEQIVARSVLSNLKPSHKFVAPVLAHRSYSETSEKWEALDSFLRHFRVKSADRFFFERLLSDAMQAEPAGAQGEPDKGEVK